MRRRNVGNSLVVSVQQTLRRVVFHAERFFERRQLRETVSANLNLPELASHPPTDPAAASETEAAGAILGILSMAHQAAILGKVCSPGVSHVEQCRDESHELPRSTRVQLAAIEEEKIFDSFLDGTGQDGLDLFDFCPGRDFPRPAREPREHHRFSFRQFVHRSSLEKLAVCFH